MTFEEICRRNLEAVDALPAQGPIKVRMNVGQTHAAEEWMPRSGGDEAHTAAAIIPHGNDSSGKAG